MKCCRNYSLLKRKTLFFDGSNFQNNVFQRIIDPSTFNPELRLQPNIQNDYFLCFGNGCKNSKKLFIAQVNYTDIMTKGDFFLGRLFPRETIAQGHFQGNYFQRYFACLSVCSLHCTTVTSAAHTAHSLGSTREVRPGK